MMEEQTNGGGFEFWRLVINLAAVGLVAGLVAMTVATVIIGND